MIKLIRSLLSNRLVVGGFLILVQLAVMLDLLLHISQINHIFYLLFHLISIIMVLYLVIKNDNPAYKVSWIILIFTFPLVGGFFYLIWGNTPLNLSRLVKMKDLDRNLFKNGNENIDFSQLSSIDTQFPKIANYTQNTGKFPIYKNSQCEYLKSGEEFFHSLVKNLKTAEKFIFMEYFIVEEGKMWNEILEILLKKVQEGVEVRFMYDDAGCLSTLPPRYYKFLKANGINAIRFNPFKPTLNTYLNNRDHRKICVIDGKVGYMGGANLADEYINEVMRFGHWKDTAVIFNGEAINNLTMMFLELWCFASETNESDVTKYLAEHSNPTKGYIQPFSDSPLDNFNVGENVYMHIINSAQKYVYITTPYLILDNELQTALCIAAQSGIDVRIVTPHIPDKKYVFAVTKSFYKPLIDAGVKICEYTPGFIHSKMIISDNNIGVVGTINLDFRSFYMHFECGTILYDCPVLYDILTDFNDIFEVSQLITTEELQKTLRITHLIHSILRIFAPMM